MSLSEALVVGAAVVGFALGVVVVLVGDAGVGVASVVAAVSGPW